MKKLLLSSIIFLSALCSFAQSTFTGGTITKNGTVIDGATITSTVRIMADSVTISHYKLSRAGIIIGKSINQLKLINGTAVQVPVLINAFDTYRIGFTGSNYVVKNLTIDSLTMDGGTWFQASFGGPYDTNNWCDSLQFSNINYTSATFGPVVSGTGLFHLDVHNNRIFYATSPADGGDYSIFAISGGSGKIYNNYRSGGWGWFTRFYASNVKGTVPQDIFIYNNINVNTTCYGNIDFHVEPAANGPLTTGANLYAYNNTAGNMSDIKFNGKYTNANVLVSALAGGYHAYVQNNLSFNVQTRGYAGLDLGGNIGSFSNLPVYVLSNNYYYATAKDAGLDSNFAPIAGSKAIDTGVTTPFAYDLRGTKRPQGKSFDAGAIEYVPACPICPSCPPPVVCTPINATTCAPFFPVCPPSADSNTCKPFFPAQRKLSKTIITYNEDGTTTIVNTFNDGSVQ